MTDAMSWFEYDTNVDWGNEDDVAKKKGWTTEDPDEKWNVRGGGHPPSFGTTQCEIMQNMDSAVKVIAVEFERVIASYVSGITWMGFVCHPYFWADRNSQSIDLMVEMWSRDQRSPECCLTLVVEEERGHLLVNHSLRAKCTGATVRGADWGVGSFMCDIDRVQLGGLVEINASKKKCSARTIRNYIAVVTKKMLFIMAVNHVGGVIQGLAIKPLRPESLEEDVVVHLAYTDKRMMGMMSTVKSRPVSITFPSDKETMVSVQTKGNVEVRDLNELVYNLTVVQLGIKQPTRAMLVLSQVDRLLDVCLTDQPPLRRVLDA
jgi:hypothetical protein